VTLLLQPVVAACLAWILFNETLGPWQMLGGGIVLSGILLCHDATTRADHAPGAEPAAAAPKRRASRN
jgi:drug/metabolite transporter (DMT)-like permease